MYKDIKITRQQSQRLEDAECRAAASVMFFGSLNDRKRCQAMKNKNPEYLAFKEICKKHCLNSQDLHKTSEKELLFHEKVIIPCTAELMMYKITPTSPSPIVTLDNRQEKRESKQTTGDQKTTRSRSPAINRNMTLKLGSSYKEHRVERELLRADGSAFPGDINSDECISLLSTVYGSAYLNSRNNWEEL